MLRIQACYLLKLVPKLFKAILSYREVNYKTEAEANAKEAEKR